MIWNKSTFTGYYEIVELLVNNGARDIEDKDSKTAIDLVDSNGNLEYIHCFEWIFNNKIVIFLTDSASNSIKSMLSSVKFVLGLTQERNCAPPIIPYF